MSRQPNLFLIGGMRCGSTTINRLLEQHPQIYMSKVKEPVFYVAEAMRRHPERFRDRPSYLESYVNAGKYRTRDAYDRLFDGVGDQRWLGEASHYLYHPEVIGTILEDCPSARAIVSLREPVDRLFSEYLLAVREGRERGGFPDFVSRCAAAGERADQRSGWMGPALHKSLQGRLLKAWLEALGKDRVKVVLFDELEREPAEVMRSIFTWLEVDPGFLPTLVHTQRGGRPKNNSIFRMVRSKNPVLKLLKSGIPPLLKTQLLEHAYRRNLERPAMDEATRAHLSDLYRDDLRLLQHLIDEDISAWLKPRPGTRPGSKHGGVPMA